MFFYRSIDKNRFPERCILYRHTKYIMKKFIKSEEEWKEILSEEEYYVTRQKGTEPAFSG